tara:strand:- start:304 stop:1161 length:858 start_codon:yes stop_codon:yes gene_type:complete
MTHASLFSGIGGFDLAAQWMGWENVFHCEYDPFCQKVLKHHFPNSKLYKDVRKFDATAYAGRIDILTGGFPCQPFSSAGKRLGTEDERHLWGEMLRIIREIKPSYVVGENVRGLLNWGGGVQFEQVCSDLEAEGYEVTPYILPACGKSAPHRRDRIWFVAYSNSSEQKRDKKANNQKKRNLRGNEEVDVFGKLSSSGNVTNSNSWRGKSQRIASGVGGVVEYIERNRFREFPIKHFLCRGDDGLSRKLDGITFSKWRRESLKAYGNAIVPQVAHEIFKAIQKTIK